MKANKLLLNEKKTDKILFGKPNRHSGEIENPKTFRYLGIHLDEGLSFKKHIAYVRRIYAANVSLFIELRKKYCRQVFSLIHTKFMFSQFISMGF